MPYMQEGKCVYKKNPDGSKGESKGCSETDDMAKKHMQALYAAENKSIAEFSMAITQATVPENGKRDRKMRLKMVTSDTGPDAYEERMSIELFHDFVERIEDGVPVPEPFDSVVCEDGWCGGMPYPSISHYKSGAGMNLPGEIEKVKVDGNRLKADATLYENSLGLAVWKSVCDDIKERSKPIEERTHKNPVRVSIGFLDLEHKHESEDGDFVFTRNSLGETCPMCDKGINGKVYLKGQLVHLAFTRVPANPRTSVEVFRMADEEIKTKLADAESIIGELADGLVGKSTVEEEVLVVKTEPEKEESRDQEVPVEPEVAVVEEPVMPVKMEHMEECADDDEDCKKKMAKKEKSKVEATVENLLDMVSKVKSKAATKSQLQPILDELLDSINKETADPQEAMMEQMRSIFREELDTKLATLRPEIVAEVLKAIPANVSVHKATETLAPRSLVINRNSLPTQQQKQMSQIEKIALQSTQVR